MSKFDDIHTEMPFAEAEEYLAAIIEDLNTIYQSNEPPVGKAGTIWRTIWGRPRRITPMNFYLRELLIEELEIRDILLKDKATEERQKAKKQLISKIEKFKQQHQHEIEGAEFILDQNESLQLELEKERQERLTAQKGLNQFIKKAEAEKDPGMVTALSHDVKALVERLKKYESVNLNELASYRRSKEKEVE